MLLLCLVSLLNLVNLSASAPAPELTLTFADKIAETCPILHYNHPDFRNHHLFKICKDWKTVSEKTNLSEADVKNARCMLYFEAFTTYCNQTKNPILRVPQADIAGFKIEEICNYAKSIKNLSALFTDDNCKAICTDEMDYAQSICSTSFYFHKIITATEPPPKPALVGPDSIPKFPADIQTPKKQQPDLSANPNTVLSPKAIKAPIQSKPVAEKTTETQVDTKDAPVGVSNEQSLKDAALNSKITEKNSVSDIKVEQSQTPQKDINLTDNKTEKNKMVVVEKISALPILTRPPSNLESQDAPKRLEQQVIISSDIKANEQANSINPPPVVPENEDLQEQEMDEDLAEGDNDIAQPETIPRDSKPVQTGESEPVNYNTEMESGDSYFFTYFMILCVIFIVGYVCYHNKQKILALILEGRRGRRQYRGRRPNSANYHKLDSNLEEAISSSCKKNTNNVIY